MSNRPFARLVALLLTTSIVSCSSATNRADHQLVLTGSSTVAPLVLEMAKRFESRHPGVRIDVQTGGSSRGIADALRGLADIGMASRPLREEERDLHAFAIAHDGVCVILHRDNPIESLTDAQIVAIYSGRIVNWSDVGGHDAPITVVNKAAGRSTLELFLDYFELDSTEIRADVVIGDNEQGIKTVAGNPHAIGYVSIGTAEFDLTAGIAIKLLPIGTVAAAVDNVAAGSFPLSRPLNLVTRTEPSGLAADFIEFARSDSVHDLIREQYFVPIAP